MKNIMTFPGGYKAVISYAPEINMFRGEFININGGADFYANDVESLQKEGQISLDVFLEMCRQDGVSPKKSSDKFALRLTPELRDLADSAAASEGISVNQWINRVISDAVQRA